MRLFRTRQLSRLFLLPLLTLDLSNPSTVTTRWALVYRSRSTLTNDYQKRKLVRKFSRVEVACSGTQGTITEYQFWIVPAGFYRLYGWLPTASAGFERSRIWNIIFLMPAEATRNQPESKEASRSHPKTVLNYSPLEAIAPSIYFYRKM